MRLLSPDLIARCKPLFIPQRQLEKNAQERACNLGSGLCIRWTLPGVLQAFYGFEWSQRRTLRHVDKAEYDLSNAISGSTHIAGMPSTSIPLKCTSEGSEPSDSMSAFKERISSTEGNFGPLHYCAVAKEWILEVRLVDLPLYSPE